MIGVFDSGIGGLTVLRALRDHHAAPYVYFGDTARLPYGTKSPNTVRNFTADAINRLQERYNLEALVIACHTASVHAADSIRDQCPFPVFDMITPLHSHMADTAFKRIAVIGTPSTIASGRHAQIMEQHCDVDARSCPLFVPLAEEGWYDTAITHAVAEEYLGDLRNTVDAVVLACTHYPLLRDVISETLDNDVAIIDPAECVANEVHATLSPSSNSATLADILVTDDPYRFETLAQMIMNDTFTASVQRVDME